MSRMKEIDEIAQGIADVTKEIMYDSIDWQIADQPVEEIGRASCRERV